LASPKFVFSEFNKAVNQVVARHFEHIFSFLSSLKYHLGEVEKAMFQSLAWHFKFIFGP